MMQLKIYLLNICLVDDCLAMPLTSIKGRQMCFHGVCLGTKITKTLSGSCFVDEITVCLCFYQQTCNMSRLDISKVERNGLAC